MIEPLGLTGERTAPGIWHENYWFARHEAAYRWVVAEVLPGVGGRLLEAGCGEGYGAEMLRAAGGGRVVGLDYEDTTLGHVRRAYPQVNVVRGNLVQMGFAAGSFGGLTSLQTIEHLWEQPRFVEECARVLAPGGTAVLSTPNRLTFPSGNWYHTRELTAAEFVELVAAEFEVTHALGLHHGPRLRAWEAASGSCVDAQLAAEHDEWGPELRELVTRTRYDDFEIRPGDLDESLDLILVAKVPG
ncbi:class I SAM-dependent methyltransferase [Kribbella sandramycini]|uniref:Class I SAM-dependent methyltransferase n=1 Tax=Kribbella sandramycini TaxID=60450 RepID=A0A7Y4L3Y8_9ACTN|nr:class I SAM-dependent methyltransferase [Kribbella sandramycini]